MGSVQILDTKGKIDPARLENLVRAGYTVRKGSRFKRVEPEGEYQLFAPSGVLVRPLPWKATRVYLEAAGWPELGKGVIR